MGLKMRRNIFLLLLVIGGMLLSISCRTESYAGGSMVRKRSGIIPCPSVGGHPERKIFNRAFYQ